MQTAAAQRTDCCWLLLLLLLQCPGLEWVGANHRKSGQNKKTRRDSYPGPRWRGPSCEDWLLPSRTFLLLAIPPLPVPALALPSRYTILADPLLSRASGAWFMPPNLAQNVPSVAHKVPRGPPRRHVNSCPREREGGYRPIPPDLKGGCRPLVRLLLQLQRLFTVQSGPVLLELYSATKRTHSLYLYSSNLSPGYLVIPPFASLLFSILSGLAAIGPTLYFQRFFSFHPSLPRFQHGVYNLCAFSCNSSPLFHPPQSRLRSRFRSHSHPRSRFHVSYCSRFRPRSRPRSHPMFVHGPPPPPLFPFPSRPRFRPRSHLTLLRSPPPSFPFPPTTPFPSLFPPPTPIPPLPPTPLAPSRPSDSVTLSMRCACTGTRPCKRSYWVPVSATPCLQKSYRVRNKTG